MNSKRLFQYDFFFQSVEPLGQYQQPDSSVLLTKQLMTSEPIVLIL